MHTSKILRSAHFRIEDEAGAPVALTAGLGVDDRLGIVSPCYDDAILGASGAILAFVTAYYDLQRAREAETGQPFFIYPNYYAFFLGGDGAVRGQAGAAPLTGDVARAYGWLDIWPDEKWVVSADAAHLWKQVEAHRITHLLLPADRGAELGAAPEAIWASAREVYRYVRPGKQATGARLLRIELAAEPLEVIAQAMAYLPAASPAHAALPPKTQRLIRALTPDPSLYRLPSA